MFELEENNVELWFLRILCPIAVAICTALIVVNRYNRSNVCNCDREYKVNQEISETLESG